MGPKGVMREKWLLSATCRRSLSTPFSLAAAKPELSFLSFVSFEGLPSETLRRLLEAAPGFEPGNEGFADLCLTTWLCRRDTPRKYCFRPELSKSARQEPQCIFWLFGVKHGVLWARDLLASPRLGGSQTESRRSLDSLGYRMSSSSFFLSSFFLSSFLSSFLPPPLLPPPPLLAFLRFSSSSFFFSTSPVLAVRRA